VKIQQERSNSKGSSRSVLLWLMVVLAVGGAFAWRATHKATTVAAQDQGNGGGGNRGNGGPGGGGGNRAVPVVTAVAVKQDLPVYLDGLGSVTAFNTVTVKSRVDGQLISIHFKEGQEVKKGDLLAEIDPRPFEVALSQAEAAQFRDQSQLTDVKRNQDRYNQLAKEGVVAQQQSDTQGALAGQIEGAVRSDQAQIDSAKLNLTYSRITSPIDGRIGLRLVDVGNIVHAADPNGLLVITQMQPISVIFTLPEDTLTAVNGRMREGAMMQVKALSRDNGTELASGTLGTIDNQIDQTTGTYRLKSQFDNGNRVLWPNQFVNARLLLNVKKDAVVIPSAAIQTGSQGTFVYAVTPDNTVEVRPVRVGITQGNVVSIDKGISPGEQVVTDGQDRLRGGMPVVAQLEGHTPAGTAGRGGSAAPGSGGGQDKSQNGGGKGAGNQGAQRRGQQNGQPGGPGKQGFLRGGTGSGTRQQ
jgi:multidrug efflux system membrane fusion protein